MGRRGSSRGGGRRAGVVAGERQQRQPGTRAPLPGGPVRDDCRQRAALQQRGQVGGGVCGGQEIDAQLHDLGAGGGRLCRLGEHPLHRRRRQRSAQQRPLRPPCRCPTLRCLHRRGAGGQRGRARGAGPRCCTCRAAHDRCPPRMRPARDGTAPLRRVERCKSRCTACSGAPRPTLALHRPIAQLAVSLVALRTPPARVNADGDGAAPAS